MKKTKSDRGSASLISFILLVPLFLGLVITAIDVSFYFSNRGVVESVARDAARTVAIFGGNGNATQSTTIERSYGSSKATACSSGRADISNAPNKYIFTKANKSELTPVECNVLASLANNNSLVSISDKTPVTVKCGPQFAQTVGTRTYCEINYTYESMPGAPLSFIQVRRANGASSGLFTNNKVIKSAESEVMNPGLVTRK